MKITIDPLDPKSVDYAIKVLNSWNRHTFQPAVEDFTRQVAAGVIGDVWRAEHIVTWRLRNQTVADRLEHGGVLGSYRLEIDPVDEHGVHYAAKERAKGGDHDFLAIGLANKTGHIEAQKGIFSRL